MTQAHTLKGHIGYWLNRLRSVVHHGFEERLRAYGVSVAEWSILVCLFDGRANSVNDMAQAIDVDKASISRVAERLRQKGLLTQETGHDRRSKVLNLTPEGISTIEKLINEANENDNHFFGDFSPLEKEQLRSLLYRALKSVPHIRLEGWINPKPNEDNMNPFPAIFNQAWQNRWPYPRTFELLKEKGLDSYEVSICGTYKAIFYSKGLTYVEDSFDGYTPLLPSDTFCAEGIKNAIVHHITQGTHFLDFIKDAANSGVTHYRVDMEKRTVTYFNKDESASHVENVPPFTQGA